MKNDFTVKVKEEDKFYLVELTDENGSFNEKIDKDLPDYNKFGCFLECINDLLISSGRNIGEYTLYRYKRDVHKKEIIKFDKFNCKGTFEYRDAKIGIKDNENAFDKIKRVFDNYNEIYPVTSIGRKTNGEMCFKVESIEIK